MDIKARATACALAGGLMLGSGIGLVLGGAYWMGETAQAQSAHARSLRLAEAAAQGFSERALQAEMKTMGPGAAALAQRQDPFVGALLRGRQSADAITQFGAHASGPALAVLPASLTHGRGPAALPFRFADGGALESARDLACLTDAVYYEARGEGPAGQAAVAQVVLNRVRHPAFPKSVCGVVFQRGSGGDGCQFSFVCDGSMRHQREQDAWRRAEDVAAKALDGAVMASIGNATHFHVAGADPGWGSNLLRVAQVGLHVFYRFGGHAGGAGAFSGQARHSTPSEDASLPNADGAPTGQYILASATTVSPASPVAQVPASAPAAAKPAASAPPHGKDAPADKSEPAAKSAAPDAPRPASVS